ncbi:hypothetical protein ONS95_007141 [Cadophora gregata]|uniref:uncharacterized protein n=1 Tax=Cadophora gregata TaxID=51156 RepID=UPI0026DB87AA|nr:uncharacterized protein ONS95_007141 [Cadophora gregata]KAK0100689.1 hypothetical protein ONS95_007141 [Cadophora gregata]KAK0117314.1 hypothetical protein ONS96_013146 [Cadophora gregata f. sp. sojae]
MPLTNINDELSPPQDENMPIELVNSPLQWHLAHYLPVELRYQILDYVEPFQRIIHVDLPRNIIPSTPSTLIVTPVRRPRIFYEDWIWQGYNKKYTETTLPGFRTPFFFCPRFDTLYFTSSAAVKIFLDENSPPASNPATTPAPTHSEHLKNMRVSRLAVRFTRDLSTTDGIQPLITMLKLFATVEVLVVTVRERQIPKAAKLRNKIVERIREVYARDRNAAKEAKKSGDSLEEMWKMPVVRFVTCAEFGAKRGG